ncbi:hypothetical protein [Petroclostridium sp. X23]|uniref:hypothetical protein n=1 Tax=Petroclostridium sp. X23 TaxID=3045146 RepID=UPI0024ADF677|nr:hypothetical protein [Petroclostridium sp. X23]WHH57847.1 hypothetical protein QKW49_18805 [Petroclostridium sp. X23]
MFGYQCKSMYILLIISAVLLIIAGCAPIKSYNEKAWKRAENAGMVQQINQTYQVGPTVFKIEKVCNDVTGYSIIYSNSKLKKGQDFCFELSDANGRIFGGVSNSSVTSAVEQNGVITYEETIPQSSSTIYLDVNIEDSNNTANPIIAKQTIPLPVVFSPGYANSIVISKKISKKIGKSDITINRIAFGKMATSIEYESQPGKYNIDKVRVNGANCRMRGASASYNDTHLKGSITLEPIENPKEIEIWFSDDFGNIDSIYVDIQKYLQVNGKDS